MTEGIKTVVYVGVALLVALVAFLSRPRIDEFKVGEQEGKILFEKFDDPAKADRMEIVRYDETVGALDEFRVARDKASGAWTLPSHGGYPADAETRVRDAALLLVDLQILGIASEVSGDHRLFGVIEPDKDKLKVGDEGVGLLVRFDDAKGQSLASLIISNKRVKGADEQRFVRVPGQDVVYTVKIDPDKLSTKFQDWIEKDLFKELKSWDVENVALKNYSVSLQPPNRVLIDKKFELAADFKDSEWKLRELKKFSQGAETIAELTEQEELNKDKLNDIKTAVDELAIADVRRKPKGLGADLKAGEGFAKDDEGVLDLAKHGFYMVPTAGGEVELLSANGEVSVGTKDGVEYVLRFGESEQDNEASEAEGRNRYLFVTTRVDMSKFPQPDLQPLPELATGTKPKAGQDAQPEAKVEAKADAKAEAKPEAKPEAKAEAKPEAKAEAKPDAKVEAKPDAKVEAQPEEKAEPKPAETSSETAKPSASDESEAKPEPEAKPETETKPEDAASAKIEPAPKTDTEAEEAQIEKDRERINKENQRKIDERNDKIKAAQEKVAKENTRFADWYYLVSDATFKKLQIGLDDVIKKKEGEAKEGQDDAQPGDGLDAFRKMQSEGLKMD